MICCVVLCWYIPTHLFFFFFNDTATTEIYTLSLHDALPISAWSSSRRPACGRWSSCRRRDRKSTRLNSSHTVISYAVFCLKKKKKLYQTYYTINKNKKKQKKKNKHHKK